MGGHRPGSRNLGRAPCATTTEVAARLLDSVWTQVRGALPSPGAPPARDSRHEVASRTAPRRASGRVGCATQEAPGGTRPSAGDGRPAVDGRGLGLHHTYRCTSQPADGLHGVETAPGC